MATNGVRAKIREFNQGQLLFKQGNRPVCAYLLLRGTVSYVRLADNRRIQLGRADEGHIVGGLELLTDQKYDTSAVADSFVEAAVLGREAVENSLGNTPPIVKQLFQQMLELIKVTSHRRDDLYASQPFMSMLKLLQLIAQSYGYGRSDDPDVMIRIGYRQLSETIHDILGFSQLEIDRHLKKMHSLSMINIDRHAVRGGLMNSLVEMPTPQKLSAMVERVWQNEPGLLAEDPVEKEFIDLYEFAQTVQARPEVLAQKFWLAELPLNILFMHRQSAHDQLKQHGPEYFRTVRELKSRLEFMTCVDELVYVDSQTMQEAFSLLGHYKLGVLYAMAGAEARRVMEQNVSERIKKILDQSAQRAADLDRNEASDVEFELITTIKKLKGLVK